MNKVDSTYAQLGTAQLQAIRRGFEADRERAKDRDSLAFLDDRIAIIDRILRSRGVTSAEL